MNCLICGNRVEFIICDDCDKRIGYVDQQMIDFYSSFGLVGLESQMNRATERAIAIAMKGYHERI